MSVGFAVGNGFIEQRGLAGGSGSGSAMSCYNLRFKVRSLASMPQSEDADESQIRFLVGTTNLREENEVSLATLRGLSLAHPRYTLWSTPSPPTKSRASLFSTIPTR